MNFFAEKHGKNSRDTHFSQISKFIESESKLKQMTSSQDIVDAILKRQDISNRNRSKLSGFFIWHIFLIHIFFLFVIFFTSLRSEKDCNLRIGFRL